MNVSICPSVMAVVRFYSGEAVKGRALERAAKLYPHLSITSELCYNVELTGECETVSGLLMKMYFCPPHAGADSCLLFSAPGRESLSAEETDVLLWLFRPPLQTEPLSEKPNLTAGKGETLVEIGPRYRCSHTGTQSRK